MKNLILLVATGFGLGYSPKAPGTVGTLLGVGLAFFLPSNLYLLIGVGLLGVLVANEAEKILEEHDSPKIVIDEIAGFLIAAYGWSGGYLVLAFVLFRILDILKPEPLRSMQKLPGGLGIMTDDLLAGLLANLAVRLATYLW